MILYHPWRSVPRISGDGAPQELLKNYLGVDPSISQELGGFVAREFFPVVHGTDVSIGAKILVELAIEHGV
jgi:hypothetical protein